MYEQGLSGVTATQIQASLHNNKPHPTPQTSPPHALQEKIPGVEVQLLVAQGSFESTVVS